MIVFEMISVFSNKHTTFVIVNKRDKMFAVCAWSQISLDTTSLRWLPTVLVKCYRFHSNTDYFLAVTRMKMKLGYSMFSGLEISKTNKFCKF